MSNAYNYNQPVYRPRLSSFLKRRRLFLIVLTVVTIVAAIILWSLWHTPKSKPDTSPEKVIGTVGSCKTYSTAYFKFCDSQDVWQLNQTDSKNGRFIFARVHGKEPQHELTVYVNTKPIPLYIQASRVLPVTVKTSSLSAGTTSELCGKYYLPGELPKIKNISVLGASFLCQPDAGAFTVIAAQVGGDYNLKLKRSDGSTANYIIYYQNLMYTPEPHTFERIVNSFSAL